MSAFQVATNSFKINTDRVEAIKQMRYVLSKGEVMFRIAEKTAGMVKLGRVVIIRGIPYVQR